MGTHSRQYLFDSLPSRFVDGSIILSPAVATGGETVPDTSAIDGVHNECVRVVSHAVVREELLSGREIGSLKYGRPKLYVEQTSEVRRWRQNRNIKMLGCQSPQS